MGDKQEELEAVVQQENHDILAIIGHGGMTHTTAGQQQMAINSSEEPGEEGELMGSSVC